ncbi:MAG: S-layer homology domain-containing protein, partial [Clostridiales bacterium]|nr:S-layer homology domain-containing protein [Clostridiales bacterium]
AGSEADVDGTDGLYVFTVSITKGAGTAQTTGQLALSIIATAYNASSDNALIVAAKSAIESAAYSVSQELAPDEASAHTYIESVITGLNTGTKNAVSKVSYTAPVAGNDTDVDGTDGLYVFTVSITKGAGTAQTTDQLTLSIIATAYNASPDNALITTAKSAIESAAYSVSQELAPDEASALDYIESVISGLSTGTVNSVSKVSYNAPVAGSEADVDGTDGLYVFTVSITKGAGTAQITSQLTLSIIATAYSVSPDNALIAAAKTAIESAAYSVSQELAPDEASALTYIESVISALNTGTDNEVTKVLYTPPTAGSATSLNGIDGSYVFTVSIAAGVGTAQETVELTLDIIATAYDPSLDNASIEAARLEIESATYSASQAMVPDELSALAYIEGVISRLDTGAEYTVSTVSYTPAIAGSDIDADGENGSCEFTVSIRKGAGTEQTTQQLTLLIVASAYYEDGDDAAIAAAKFAIESATYLVSQDSVADEATALYLIESVISGLNTETENLVSKVSFTPATAGNATDIDGSNGSYVFTVLISKGSGTAQTTEQLALAIIAAPYDPTQDNADIEAAKSAIESATYSTTQEVAATEAAALAYINSVISGLDTGIEFAAAKISFAPAIAGTATDLDGENGSYVFTVSIKKGAGTEQATVELTLDIVATPYDAEPDNASIAVARSAIEGLSYSVSQALAPDEATALAYIESAISALNTGTENAITKISYTAPIAGSETDADGTNGSYAFKVSIAKGAGTAQETAELTLAIIATASDPEHGLSSDANLSALAVSGVALSPAFSEDVTQYSANVENSTTSVLVTAAAKEAHATVRGTGTRSLLADMNIINVIVNAEDSTTKTYTITIYRNSYVPPSETPSTPGPSATPAPSATPVPSATPIVIATAPTAPAANGNATVSYALSGNTATLDLTIDKVNEIIGKTEETIVDFDLSQINGVSQVQLPTSAVQRIAETELGLSISVFGGEIALNHEATSELARTAESKTIVIRIEQIAQESLSEILHRTVNDRPVYDITVQSGNSFISEFGDGVITIRIPYALKPGELSSKVIVYHLKDDGTVEKMNSTYDINGSCAVFSTTHLSTYYIGYDAWINKYGDVTETAWYYDAVRYVSENGIFNGTDKGFEPETNLTRAMMVTVLYNLVKPAEAPTSFVFTDVPPGEWYSDPIAWATSEGIVAGVGNGLFQPDRAITREEMMAILYRFATWQGKGSTEDLVLAPGYDDASQISDWAYEAVAWNSKNGIVSGISGNIMSPKGTATRAQAAQVLMNYLKLYSN